MQSKSTRKSMSLTMTTNVTTLPGVKVIFTQWKRFSPDGMTSTKARKWPMRSRMHKTISGISSAMMSA